MKTATCPAGTPWCVRHDADPWHGSDPESLDYACWGDEVKFRTHDGAEVTLQLMRLSGEPLLLEIDGQQFTDSQLWALFERGLDLFSQDTTA